MLPISTGLSMGFPSPEFDTDVEEHGLPPNLGPEDGPRLRHAFFSLMARTRGSSAADGKNMARTWQYYGRAFSP